MRYKIGEIEGIGPARTEEPGAANIKTTDDLLKLYCDPGGCKAGAGKTGASESQLHKWVIMADLMRIQGANPASRTAGGCGRGYRQGIAHP